MAPDSRIAPILGRRSIRKYLPRDVEDNIIRALLEAAMAAPSAREADPWRFVVVRDRGQLQRLSEGLPNGKMLADAPLGIAVCGEQAAAHDGQLSYMLQDCTAAIENILLAAHALGLGACWLGVHPREERIGYVSHVLGLPEETVPVCCIAIGYPAVHKEARTRYNEQYVHFDTW